MEKEFNFREKIELETYNSESFVPGVKVITFKRFNREFNEFIKKLKEKVPIKQTWSECKESYKIRTHKVIDKLAGDLI